MFCYLSFFEAQATMVVTDANLDEVFDLLIDQELRRLAKVLENICLLNVL